MTEERTKLWGIKIWDATGHYYYTEVDISTDLKHNRPTDSQVAYGSKFPYHIHNGLPSYFSGSCSGNFSDNQSTECYEEYNFDENHIGEDIVYNTIYMTGFMKWLHNDYTKYLQLSENLVIPVGILGEVSLSTTHSIDDGYDCKISFDWEQLDEEYSLEHSLSNNCPNCQAMVTPHMVFCSKCGTRLVIDDEQS